MLSQGGVILSLSRIKGFIMGVCWQVLGFLAVMRESVCVCVSLVCQQVGVQAH